MKNHILFIFLIWGFWAGAQEDAWVYFNAKPNSQFYFDNPLEMLSQRALDRRANQNIALDLQDIPIDQDFVDQVTSTNGIQVMAKSKWLNALHVRGSVESVEALSSLSFVDHVQFANHSLNPAGRTSKTKSPKKPASTAVTFPYGGSANQIEMLNGHLLHQQDFTGSGKIIAVLDAGFPAVNVAQPFARLRENNLILGGYNFVDRNDNFYTRGNHGTLVLSTIGGYTAGQLVGTAPDASYYLFITEDVNSENPVEESYWVEAAEAADSLGVDVINTSLGYFGYDNASYSYSYEDMNGTTAFASRGAEVAFLRGMVVVVSAGNSGNGPNPFIGVPADAENVLTIGAVDADGQYAGFSSIGPTADGRIKPDVMARGLQATVSSTSGEITTASGTSFSSPIMAGMVASFWQAIPWATNAQVMQMIKESANMYDFPTFEMGYGIPDFALALEMALAVGEVKKIEYTVLPNPAQDFISISLPVNVKSAGFAIYNTLGQMIFQKAISTNDAAVNLDLLASGMYIYKITSAGAAQTGKLLIH